MVLDPPQPALTADVPLSALARWFTVSGQFNRNRRGNRGVWALFATIDRYVLRGVATALAGVTIVLLAILVSYQLAPLLGLAAGRGVPHDLGFALIRLSAAGNLSAGCPSCIAFCA